jgi:transcriptional regulator with XRE-family HTH domain
MTHDQYHGRNIRIIRQLQGLKQSLFAVKLGVSQQYVSKVENQKTIPREKLEPIAAVLGVSVKTIENFNERLLLLSEVESATPQVPMPIKEVIEHFKKEIARKDALITELRTKLNAYNPSNKLP